MSIEVQNGNIAKPVLSAIAVKLSKAKIREIVFDKCGGKCAYCGVDLVKGWNVDHIKPQIFGGTNELDNLNPSCKDCNNYKCHTDLEGYRKQLHKMLNEKLEYLFKSKTKMQVAMNMGSIKHTLWDGKFHFECCYDYLVEKDSFKKAMIEFAKLHVTKALTSAHINMQLPIEDLEFTLNSYPLTNIK